ncbi:hypothetical protein CVIRNUC_000685 [Coccomyxa viridis]|uniref:Iron-binding zinc finger CDGSH type domain-containing protein n=1 Tax=Coccomyxa viridis TaxID=1274662 RepID=A0AAV1HRI7_9CHLO|nr:hypothetical protein CVIRNUC_000685 [Coccomyxa viridis]
MQKPQAPAPPQSPKISYEKEAKCTCGKTKRPPNCDGSHAKRSKTGFVTPSWQTQLTAESLLAAQEQ